jgi:hypothetical protein
MNGFGPAYCSEIQPTRIRVTGVAVGHLVFNALYILQTQTATVAIPALDWRYFFIFLCLDCLFMVIVYFFYPERNACVSSMTSFLVASVDLNIEQNSGGDCWDLWR